MKNERIKISKEKCNLKAPESRFKELKGPDLGPETRHGRGVAQVLQQQEHEGGCQ